MSQELAPLDGEKALEFYRAFVKRSEYISAEQINLLMDGEDQVPLPGCPACSTPSESVMWAVTGDAIILHVGSCGHRFRVARPVMEQSSGGHGGIFVAEWTP
ncbi:hypothetical protein AB0M57_04905 [Streptomyces sp. NPDC051597]|uniref:hypothetical protein n=1 Tax=Streptomyces sp. NPDC051597 TaxID=3155049 RepID=UPI00343F5C33